MTGALCLNTSPLEDALLPLMDASEIHDRIHAMRLQEDSYYCSRDYIQEAGSVLKDCRKPVDATCRVKMSEWSYQVVDFCKFRRETVFIGMSLLDRYLSTKYGRKALMNRKEYQLAAMTTLYIAIKVHEPLEMETSLLADLSRGCYTETEIAAMEREVLMALNWRLQGPTPLTFVQHFLALLPESVHPSVTSAIMDYARFQTELAVAEYKLVGTKYSFIALAAILNAIEGIDTAMLPLKHQGIFLRAVEKFSGVMVEDVKPAQRYLNAILRQVYATEDKNSRRAAKSYSTSDSLDKAHHNHKGRKSRQRTTRTKASSPISVATAT